MQPTTINEPRKKRDREIIIGIDFGTTNSLVSVFEGGKCVVIPQEGDSLSIPSVVGIKDGEIVIGEGARECKNHISSIKRLITKKVSAPDASPNMEKDDCALCIGYASQIFSSLKKAAEKYLGHSISMSVVTVPAYFDNTSRSAIRDAATIAGLKVVRLLSEPTAAALFYGIDENKEKGRYLVYDLGGGTFDVSILEFHKGIFKVSCSDGDDQLGGDNFDQSLLEHLVQKYELEISDEEKVELLEKCRSIKEELSRTRRVVRSFGHRNKNIRLDVALEEFEEIVKKDVEKTINILKRAVRTANLSTNEIEGVLLVGGATRIPMIEKRVSELFGAEKIISGVDPETIVARGAGLMGSFLDGRNPKRVLLLDVLPLSLGIETLDGTMEKIIMKDSPIPIQQSQILTNAVDNQTSFKIRILQGERELAQDNRFLAEFTLDNLPPLPMGKTRIKVTLKVNDDGILEVSATDLLTGAVQAIEINPYYGLDKESIKKMVEDSFSNLEEDIKKRSQVEAQKHAERVLQVLRRAINENESLLTHEEKKKMNEQIQIVEASMKKYDSIRIRKELDTLEKVADPFLKRRLDFLFKEMKIDLKRVT